MVAFFFAYFSLVSILAGALTVALRNPVHCGIALLTLLLHVAGLFFLLNAEFLAIVQIIVYVAAVLRRGDTYAVGIKMFSDYLLQFEIVGVFLLGAIIGAIVLAKTPTAADTDSHEA